MKRLFRFPFRTSSDIRRDIDDELSFHLDARAAELVRGGMREDDARCQALREMGDRGRAERALGVNGARVERRRRAAIWMGELRRDAALGSRLLRRNPGFASVAVLTLAIGIGATTAIFGALDAALLRPLPYPEPDRLMEIAETRPDGGTNSVSGGAFLDWRASQTHFDAVVLTGRVTANLRRGGTTERLRGMEVSHEFLDVLAVAPLLGRGFEAEHDRPGGRADVVMLSEALWRSHFGADPAIVGDTVLLDDVPRTVIAILPRGAWLFPDDRFFVPAVLEPGTPRAERSPHWAAVFGRLRRDVSVAQADAELKAIKARLDPDYPPFKRDWNVAVRPVTDMIGETTRTPLLILATAAALVLLIACANIAALLIARATGRGQELAVRAALGAGGGRLVRQILTENAVLATLGGVAGIALAYGATAVLARMASEVMPIDVAPALNVRALAFAAAATAAAALLAGLLPALGARRTRVNDALKSGGRGSTGRQRTQGALVVAEVALTVVLLFSAGLLLLSLARTASDDPGFDPTRVLAFDVSLPPASYGTHESRLAFVDAMLESLRALPSVERAGSGMAVPFSRGGFGEGLRRPDMHADDGGLARVDFVSPDFLEALGARLVAGRLFEPSHNRSGDEPPVIINETVRRQYFADRDALGEALLVAGKPTRVIGVIADIVHLQLDFDRRPSVYLPQALESSSIAVVVRTPLDPGALIAPARDALARLDAGVALANPRALDDARDASLRSRQVMLGLVATFAAVALALASIGLYGVMAYAVALRRREFGLRLALGAGRRDIVRDVLRRGLRLTAAGIAAGVACAFVAGRLIASQLYRVDQTNPWMLGAAAGVVLLVALFASLAPALRAGATDPLTSLQV